MHNLVQRIMRGVIFCFVTVAITACAGLTDYSGSEQGAEQPNAKSANGLPRIDAIRLRVAQNAMDNGDYNTAIRFFESVRKSSPTHPAPLIGIAQAHMAAGNHKEAIVAYRDALGLHPNNDEALDGIARALILTGDYREAIEYFNRSLAKAPSAPLHNRLGVAHDLAGDGEGAQKHYRAALALDPEAISPRNNLALSLAISENYDEAIKQIERVAAHPQATSKHRQNLAFVYGMAGENDEALAGLSEAGLTSSEIAENRALYKRIRAHARAGNRAAILEYLRNGREMGEPMMADTMSEPTYPATEMASIKPDHELNSSDKDAIGAPEPLTKRQAAPTSLRRSAVASDPVSRGMGLAGMVYRVQLAAYRTSKTALRGVRILTSILKDAAPAFNVLVRDPRRENKRAIDFRIRTPQLPNREVAMDLCSKVRSGGHPDCLVILHNPRIWAGVDIPDASKFARAASALRLSSGGKVGPYHLQLASYRTERAATKGQAILKKLLGDRNVKLDILVRRANNADPAAFNYQVRSGPISSRADGMALCEALKKQGHQGCLMIQHNGLVWKNLAMESGPENSAPGKTAPEKTAMKSSDRSSMPAEKEAGKVMSGGNIKSGDGKPEQTTESQLKPTMSKAAKPAEGKGPSSSSARSEKSPTMAPTQLQRRSSASSPETLLSSYRVQVASFRTEGAAAKGHAVLEKLLGNRDDVNLDILVRRARSGGAKAFDYQIRSGPIQSRAQGLALCEKLKKAGHSGCLVVQHNDQMWKTVANAGGSKKAAVESPRRAGDANTTGRLQEPDPVNLVIELPSRSVMETVHTISAGWQDRAKQPEVPIFSPSLAV